MIFGSGSVGWIIYRDRHKLSLSGRVLKIVVALRIYVIGNMASGYLAFVFRYGMFTFSKSADLAMASSDKGHKTQRSWFSKFLYDCSALRGACMNLE